MSNSDTGVNGEGGVKRCKAGKRILIVAHGNSLRGLMKYLKQWSDEEIIKVEIPQALPLVIELDADLRPLRDYYLASEEEVKVAKAKVGVQDNPKQVTTTTIATENGN
ncbi:hypothetical protein EGW08_015621 [Elysia chlorotica]|uniref:phosphoglycerate mutase (2,3-diphosphoglycerate-dependent) n=1 Tax=Elysia chlorotica TaxID=188477 RepID=A0A433T529_ELYCH|nr:hypothetical protein EGW08_015621 [Elysia chlorotica]